MLIFPVFTEGNYPTQVGSQAPVAYEGCLNSAQMVMITGYEGHFRDRIETAMRDGAFVPRPGLWVVIDESTDGNPITMRGMIFTINPDGSMVQGAHHKTRIPRLTTWPPK